MALLINGKSAVHRNSGALVRTDDICYVDKQTVCFTNIAKSEDAANTAQSVFHNGNPLCHKASYFSKSTGDEAGDAGVRSGTIAGKAMFTSASTDVLIEGNPAVKLGDKMISNEGNTSEGVLL